MFNSKANLSTEEELKLLELEINNKRRIIEMRRELQLLDSSIKQGKQLIYFLL
jgi:hypothetical protein